MARVADPDLRYDMYLLIVIGGSALVLGLAYWPCGGSLARLFRPDREAETPAAALRDDVDYAPIPTHFLLGRHFSALTRRSASPSEPSRYSAAKC